jgi:hypothetical protein
MFKLSAEEFSSLRSQSVISSTGYGGWRTAPYAFTEQGVPMLFHGSSAAHAPLR